MLTRAKLSRAPDDAALLKIIEEGIRGTEMPGAGAMSDREMRQTAAYVRSLGKVPLKPVPGDPAHGAEIYRGKGDCATLPFDQRRGRCRRTGSVGHRRRRAARRICANRWSIRRRPFRRSICW